MCRVQRDKKIDVLRLFIAAFVFFAAIAVMCFVFRVIGDAFALFVNFMIGGPI